MGTYTGTYRAQDVYSTSMAVIVASHNAIHAALIGCGMAQVSLTDYPGQTGVYVTTAPAAGETQYPAFVSAANNVRSDGYKLYKHPTLNLYLLVEFFVYQDGSTSRIASCSFTVATELVDGVLTASKKSAPIFTQEALLTGTAPAGFPQWPYTAEPLIASCGPDHLWIYSSLVRATYVAPDGYHVLKDNTPAVGFGVFASDIEPDTYIMVAPPRVTRANAAYYTEQLSKPRPYGWRVYGMNKGTFETYPCCSAGFVIDPATSSTAEGFRVVRASKYIGGKLHQFNLGYMVRAAFVDLMSLQVDLLGTTVPKEYRACLALGPCSIMTANMNADEYSIPILPWGN